MKKIANYNGFFYFERRLLEDYLNDMVSQGYTLKLGSLRHKFEYTPDKKVYYHVDSNKVKKRYFGQKKPNDDYIELFESQGYHYIGSVNSFNIFESKNRESIFVDQEESEIVEGIFSKEFRYIYAEIILALWLLFIVFFMNNDASYMVYSKSLLGLEIYLLLHFIGRIAFIDYPLIRYKIKKEIDYTYHHVFKRSFIYSMFLGMGLFYAIGYLCAINIRILLSWVLLMIVITLVSMIIIKPERINVLNKISNISLVCYIVILAAFFNSNPEFTLQHETIRFKEFQERSSLMEWAWYECKDNSEGLYLVDVYEPILVDSVLDDFIKGRNYVKEGSHYIFDDYIVVQKNNRFLRMSKDFYNKYYQSLEW